MQLVENLVAETARAISFLSRIRTPDRYFAGHDGSLSRTVAAFPLAGFVIAMPAALIIYALSALAVEPVLIALIALSLQIMVTGALHEDGLSDTADGLGGGRDRDRALAIMKDSRIGTYGALALILSVALRITALSILIAKVQPPSTALAFIAAATLSRTLMVWHWAFLPSARSDGVAASAGKPDPEAVRTAFALGTITTAVLCLLSLPFHAWFVAVALAITATVVFTRHVQRRVDGHTGDTIGASQQVSEIGFLLALAMIV